jgi:hypothetical protein
MLVEVFDKLDADPELDVRHCKVWSIASGLRRQKQAINGLDG